MNILNIFKSTTRRRREIVNRLLKAKEISVEEATILLCNTTVRVSVGKVENKAETGGQIVYGDDHSRNGPDMFDEDDDDDFG